jgi:hypothetical protein
LDSPSRSLTRGTKEATKSTATTTRVASVTNPARPARSPVARARGRPHPGQGRARRLAEQEGEHPLRGVGQPQVEIPKYLCQPGHEEAQIVLPLLEMACQEICFNVVAEALLRDAKK